MQDEIFVVSAPEELSLRGGEEMEMHYSTVWLVLYQLLEPLLRELGTNVHRLEWFKDVSMKLISIVGVIIFQVEMFFIRNTKQQQQ